MIKNSINSVWRKHLTRLLICGFLVVGFTSQASAQIVHLSLCIDASGSIGETGFDLQVQGTADAIRDVVPTDGTVELSVVIFGTVGTPLTFTETDNGNTPTNSIIVDSATDIEDVATEVESVTFPSPGQGTNTQDCINEAMVLQGCGPVEGAGTCPDVIQLIDISTDGNPTLTSFSGTTCVNNGSTQDPACHADAVAASDEARLRGVDAINVIGVGTGITVSNMQDWSFDAVTTPPPAPRPASSTIEVFDPGNIDGGVNGYTVGDPEIGDRGYVVLVGDFTQYEPTINAKIFNELNIESDLTVVKSVDSALIYSGATLTYTLAVTNNGNLEVPALVGVDTLPPGVTFVSADDNPSTPNVNCMENSGEVTCDIGTIAGNTTINIDVVVTVD